MSCVSLEKQLHVDYNIDRGLAMCMTLSRVLFLVIQYAVYKAP